VLCSVTELKGTLGRLGAKLATVETLTLSSDDRVREMDSTIEQQTTQQHHLSELITRALAKKYLVSGQLDTARSTAKNLTTENAVGDWLTHGHVVSGRGRARER